MATVVVGQTFHGSLAPAPVERDADTQAPPNVVATGASRSLALRSVRREGRVPAGGADGRRAQSRLEFDATRPPVLQVQAHHRAVRLDVPHRRGRVLGDPGDRLERRAGPRRTATSMHRIKRPHVRFYYSGPHLHMVVLRENGATYWVVNTVLDSLSNETMLAIARGLAPARRQVGFRPWLRGARSGSSGPAGSAWSPAACFAELGHDVIVRDVAAGEDRGARGAARLPFHEPGPVGAARAERRAAPLHARRGRASPGLTSLFICVQTPPTYSGDADLSYVWTALDELPRDDERPDPRDEVDGARRHGREGARGARGARAGRTSATSRTRSSSPRGALCATSWSPTAIVVGAFDEGDAAAVEALYAGIEAPVVRTDVASAEMIKLAAERVPDDAHQLHQRDRQRVRGRRRGRGRGGARHRPRPAGSGRISCAPASATAAAASPRTRSRSSSSRRTPATTSSCSSAVIEVNELQKRRVIQKLQKHLGKLRGKKVALLGLAFKAGTDDMREAPSLVLASRLLAEGAEVRAWDPVATAGELMKGATLCDDRPRGGDRRRRRRDRHRVGRAARARVAGDPRCDGAAADHRRPEPPRPGRGARGGFRVRGHRPADLAVRDAPETAEPEPGVTS